MQLFVNLVERLNSPVYSVPPCIWCFLQCIPNVIIVCIYLPLNKLFTDLACIVSVQYCWGGSASGMLGRTPDRIFETFNFFGVKFMSICTVMYRYKFIMYVKVAYDRC